MKWLHLAIVLLPVVTGCGGGTETMRRMESDAELQAQDEREFANSPDIQLSELRERLLALGMRESDIRPAKEEHGVEIFRLHIDDATFAGLNKAALAKLELDSRYRFQLANAAQARALAHHSVSEDAARRRVRYWRELAANGEVGRFPRYRPGSDMTAYARSLERYCGYEPGEALGVVDGRWLEYRHRMADRAVEEQGQGTTAVASFKCVVRIVYATRLQPYFVGNRGRSGVVTS